jgi:cob(I)alamin adenosyltransferase
MEQGGVHEMTIGDLAEAVGVTARAIRHYESVGLLEPAERSVGGHRRYTRDDLDRLGRITALRRAGFGLEPIRRLLASSSRDEALAVAKRRLERSEIDLAVARRLDSRLHRLVSLLEVTDEKSIDQLVEEMKVEGMNVSLDSISTRLGDGGETDLADGARVAKTDPVIEAVGSVEELGTHLGLLLAAEELPDSQRPVLERIANNLFDIGSDLSSPATDGERRPRVGAEYVDWVDRACSGANASLDPLDSFVVWFDSPVAARLNVCRSTCRRAERAVFAVEDANPQIGRYLNRLSDLLFILARANGTGGEHLWEPGRSVA